MADWLTFPFLPINVLHYIITFCVCFIIIVVALKIVRSLQGDAPADLDRNRTAAAGLCDFPDCVRCRRHAEILMRARTRLTYCDDQDGSTKIQKNSAWLSLLKDIESSKCRLTYETKIEEVGAQHESIQNPLVLHVKGLQAKPVWRVEEFPGLPILSEQADSIRSEFSSMFHELASGGFCSHFWKVNKTPSGRWLMCHLLDQGRKTEAAISCPMTWKTITSLPSAMTGNLFGNVAFSVMEPGTVVLPHFGPTNMRIRCHLGLQVPSLCELQVGIATLHWQEGGLLCFDETFLHSVQCKGDKSNHLITSTSDDELQQDLTLYRAVLIVDLWHPDLTEEQKSIIDFAFSPCN